MRDFLQCFEVETVLIKCVVGVVTQIPARADTVGDHLTVEADGDVRAVGLQIHPRQRIRQSNGVVSIRQRRVREIHDRWRRLCIDMRVIGITAGQLYRSDIKLNRYRRADRIGPESHCIQHDGLHRAAVKRVKIDVERAAFALNHTLCRRKRDAQSNQTNDEKVFEMMHSKNLNKRHRSQYRCEVDGQK